MKTNAKKKFIFYSISHFSPDFLYSFFFLGLRPKTSLSLSSLSLSILAMEIKLKLKVLGDPWERPTTTETHHDGDLSPQIHNHPSLLISLLLENLGFFFWNLLEDFGNCGCDLWWSMSSLMAMGLLWVGGWI